MNSALCSLKAHKKPVFQWHYALRCKDKIPETQSTDAGMPDSLPSATEVQSDCGQKVLHLGEALGRKGTRRREVKIQ